LFGLLLSTSRGAWLALLAALVVGLLWWLTALLQGSRPPRRRWLFLGILSFTVFTILALFLFRPDVPQRLMHTLPLLNGGTTRLDLFRNSLILAQEYPFIGAGLGGFMMLYSTYAYLLHVGFIIHAHNIFLDVSIEQGLFAIAALVWMWGLFALALWRDAADGRLRPYLAAAALSLLTILLHGLVEDALYGSRALMLLFVPLAFALPYPPREAQTAGRRRRIVLALAILLLLAGLLLWQRPLRSSATSNMAAVRQSQVELSRYAWPDWPIQDALRREIDLSTVVEGYERALALNPDNAAANRRLGQIELSFAEYEDALLHLSTAFRRTPWDNATRQLLGEAYFANGRIEDGAAMWSSVTNANHQLEVRAYWYEHIADEERRAALQIPPDG
jgi:tetratricopeptide (TPR) repeat protein